MRSGRSIRDDAALGQTVALVTAAAAVAVVVTYLVSACVFPGMGRADPAFAAYLRVDLFVSTVTLVLLCSLLVTYARIYADIPNPFTLGLLLFTIALLLFACTSYPVFPLLFGRPEPLGGDPFTILPNLFASAAVAILRYQSYA